jgi:hypothetical protein
VQASISLVAVIDFHQESELDRDAVIRSSDIKNWQPIGGRIAAPMMAPHPECGLHSI